MAFPTAVNGQITDAVTQANVEVVGEAPAPATDSADQGLAQSACVAMENAADSLSEG